MFLNLVVYIMTATACLVCHPSQVMPATPAPAPLVNERFTRVRMHIHLIDESGGQGGGVLAVLGLFMGK